MNLARISSRTDYVDEVYKTLLDAISAGTLAPGERITQEDLAEQLNVSRSPVLQALRLLKKDGLLQEAPGRGLVVARLEPERIGHLYRVRGALDGLAARLAAERGERIDLALIEAGRAAAAGQDVKAMIEADTAFHSAIYEASGNPLLIENASLQWVHLRRVMGAVLQHSSGRSIIWDEHEAIVQAIHDRDADRAAHLAEHHASLAGRNLVEHLQTLQSTAPLAA
ncbi:GntR family transcriptional regulator [Hydrogenophaga sp. R2]|uniref:GntR family transcriptional regulator n=1 Tax=Hydrogenophaga sp. R2 TaxID=3132827 RepID=UPI003CF3A075